MTYSETATDDYNEVRLRGRLSGEPERRELPSGDVLLTFRITVRRPERERGLLDSIDCVSTRLKVHRSVECYAPGDAVEVDGALRRRFWRGPSGPRSRYAVDVQAIRRIKAGRSAAASPDPKRASV